MEAFYILIHKNNLKQILFFVKDSELPKINLAQSSAQKFSEENNFQRHEKFDWHINKKHPQCFLFESQNKNIDFFTNIDKTQWLSFPLAIQKLTDGKQKNFIQLAVQYLSYGCIDDSVIAADYDEKFIRELGQ